MSTSSSTCHLSFASNFHICVKCEGTHLKGHILLSFTDKYQLDMNLSAMCLRAYVSQVFLETLPK